MKKLKYVTEVIGDEYQEWQRGEVIIITAQTGTGKNYFVEHTLLPYCIESGKSILYMCNRIPLKGQSKQAFAKLQNLQLTDDEVENEKAIGIVTVVSYQELQAIIEKAIFNDPAGENNIEINNLQNHDYIVFDESHYFVSDAAFNPRTHYVIDHFLRKKKDNSIYIYMSATPDNLPEHLSEIHPKIKEYFTGKDYSYVKVKYYKKESDLVTLINRDKTNNKWLIFVTNLERAVKLKNDIRGAKFVCSRNQIEKYTGQMDYSVMESITRKSKFDCRVLITTKTLDNGVNLHDELLTNIVIDASNETDFIQMLGRKRVKYENPQKVSLYIPAKSKSSFNGRLQRAKMKNEKVKEFKKNPEQAQAWFKERYYSDIERAGREIGGLFFQNPKGEYQINPPGHIAVLKTINFNQRMMNEFDKHPVMAYVQEQLSWIDKHYCSNNWIAEDVEIKESLEQYLKNNAGKVMLMQPDRQELIEKINLRNPDNNRLLKSRLTLNAYLEEIGSEYIIKEFETSRTINGKTKRYKTAWKIIKT